MGMSDEKDILIVGDPRERFATEIRLSFRHWQVYNCVNLFALHGRQFRVAYFTEAARRHKNWPRVLDALGDEGRLLRFCEYEEPVADPQDFGDAVLLSTIRRSRHSQDWV